jgi:hypothetical protein
MGEIPWLREMAPPELLVLFSEEEEAVRDAVRDLIQRARQDPDLESQLVDLLDASVEHQNDDTSASLWISVILGECGSEEAIQTLLRALALDADEVLQDAAGVALLRTGATAMESLMDCLEDDASVTLRRAGYGLLGLVGALDDDGLTRRVEDFLEERVRREGAQPHQDSALEETCQAVAQLGSVGLTDLLKTVLTEAFPRGNVAIEDAIAHLEENENATPFVGTLLPWEERYGWLFEDERDAARLSRSPVDQGRVPGAASSPGDEPDDEREIPGFLRGLNLEGE